MSEDLLNEAANEQVRDVSEQYQTYLQDKVEVSRARRQAALAPEGGPVPNDDPHGELSAPPHRAQDEAAHTVAEVAAQVGAAA